MSSREPTRVSSRELRKVQQVQAYLQKQELRNLQKQANEVVCKRSSQRSPEDLQFIQQNRRLFAETERRHRQKLLEDERRKEVFDSPEELLLKSRALADLLRTGRHVVFYTGAGISTAADIPDYRGPNGIWTRKEKGEACIDPSNPLDLTKAIPTFAHMAMVRLHERGFLKYIVSQNCDGLHVRSGFPRSCLSEVHGNMYLEVCSNCDPNLEYFRSFDLTEKTRWRSHQTDRVCHRCKNHLRDTIVLFGEKSRTESPMNWDAAAAHAAAADVIVCMGTSLKVLQDYPCLWPSQSKLVIMNLQWTPKDQNCQLKIHGRCDDVMHMVMSHLSLQVEPYIAYRDPLRQMAVPLRDGEPFPNGNRPGWFGQGCKTVAVKAKPEISAKRKRKAKKS